MNQLRQQIIDKASPIVVKVGTRVLTGPHGTLDLRRVEQLAGQVHFLRRQNRRVVLVSSGAVGAGLGPLGMRQRPADVATLQAVAAVGQTRLIEAYDRFFSKHNYHAAQVLLTADDLDDRSRYLNVRNTLRSLLQLGAIPIINENDTVAVEELQTTFGDNDRLAALVTNLLRAPLLIILSDVRGLFDGPPESGATELISQVDHIDDSVMAMVRDTNLRISKGGMASKLKAAKIVTAAGENVILASGHEPNVVERIVGGEQVGTLFVASQRTLSPYKRWIGFSAQSRGVATLDSGAGQAVKRSGGSVLAIGITHIQGEFMKGDAIDIADHQGHIIARGLSNYSSVELHQIKGTRSDQIAEILGHCPYETVIHRDNLLVM